jgi:hypothetical protein
MAQRKITILGELTEMQARFLLDLVLQYTASNAGDLERVIHGGIMLEETRDHMGEDGWVGLVAKINFLHKTVGCADHCHDRTDNANLQ